MARHQTCVQIDGIRTSLSPFRLYNTANSIAAMPVRGVRVTNGMTPSQRPEADATWTYAAHPEPRKRFCSRGGDTARKTRSRARSHRCSQRDYKSIDTAHVIPVGHYSSTQQQHTDASQTGRDVRNSQTNFVNRRIFAYDTWTVAQKNPARSTRRSAVRWTLMSLTSHNTVAATATTTTIHAGSHPEHF